MSYRKSLVCGNNQAQAGLFCYLVYTDEKYYISKGNWF